MRLPSRIRDEFRRWGRAGGLARAARVGRERRTAVARRAATARWIRTRFGAPDFATLGLPGGDIVDAGLADLAAGDVTIESLVLSVAAPRLRRESVPLGSVHEHPEDRLFELLSRDAADLAHARYNAWLRQIASFADACRGARRDRGRGAP